MLTIDFNLPLSEEVEIVPIADVHIGNKLCDEAEFKRTIDYILEEPADPKCARICLLNGDLTESVTRKSVGSVFDQEMTPSVQMAMMIKYLLPLTETSAKYPKGKILSYCAGNHDFGRYSDTGISMSETIAVRLGLEDRYSVDGCYSFISLKQIARKENQMSFTVYNQHMTGGGSTVGGKANRVAKISNGVIADLIVGSHVHSPITFKEDIMIPYGQHKKVMPKTITYLVTNAFLRYGDYAQRNGYKPSTVTVPRVFVRQARANTKEISKRFFYTEVLL